MRGWSQQVGVACPGPEVSALQVVSLSSAP